MKWARREPGVGYLDTWLWIPKPRMSQAQIKSALIYVNPRSDVPVVAFQEEAHHWRVPRNFLSREARGRVPYPIYDTRFIDFPRVSLRSSVVLDAKAPDQTYQREGYQALLDNYDGILCLRCGSGKSPVALHAAAQFDVPILILVNDKGLGEQWRGEIKRFLGLRDDEIGQCYDNVFSWQHAITVASLQTIASRVADNRLPPEMTRHFGIIIVDESHVIGAPYFNTAIPPFHGRRWGLSATPVREDGFDSLVRYTMGFVVYTYLTPDLMPRVIFRRLNTKINFGDPKVHALTHDVTNELHLMMLYGYLATLDERMNKVVADVNALVDQKRKVLILTHSRESCELLGARFANGGATHGGVKAAEHRRVVKTCNPVVAIMQRGKQALDKPDLDALVVVEPFTKKAVIQQTMGRILRNFVGKTNPVVLFYEDVHIKALHKMCNKIRVALNKWPANKGGRIKYTVLKSW